MIDHDLNKNVDDANDVLKNATLAAEKLRKESGVMWLYVTSLLLFVLFFVILITGTQNKCK